MTIRGKGTGSAAECLAAIRRLYFRTSPATIARDFDRAIDLLKSLPSEAERERATVYMEGLAQLRQEWAAARRGASSPAVTPPRRATRTSRRARR